MLYVDTSSLVKGYIDEAGSPEVRAHLTDQDFVVTSALTLVEAHSAFSRARFATSSPLSTDRYQAAIEAFETSWRNFILVSPTETIIRGAADLAATRQLRAYDAVHLASAIWFRAEIGALDILVHDGALRRAAIAEGFDVFPAMNP